MKTLGLDLDGVVYLWQEAAFIHVRDFHGYGGTYGDLFTSEYWNNKSEIFKTNIVNIESLYYKFPPSFKTQALFRRLAEKRDIVYITHRYPNLANVTLKFLKDFKYPNPDHVIFSKDKAYDVRLAGCDEFVDDRWVIAQALNNICTSYLMAQPWNVGHRDGLKVIHSLEELERILE